jgi:hypothetical protein
VTVGTSKNRETAISEMGGLSHNVQDQALRGPEIAKSALYDAAYACGPDVRAGNLAEREVRDELATAAAHWDGCQALGGLRTIHHIIKCGLEGRPFPVSADPSLSLTAGRGYRNPIRLT